MTRQNNENILNKKLLTAKEAQSYLGVGRYTDFRDIVNRGEIGFKCVGKSKRFTIQELDRWLSKPDYHIDYSSEEKSTTHTIRLSKTENVYSLEKLLAEQRLKMQNALQSKGLRNFKRKLINKQPENCPA